MSRESRVVMDPRFKWRDWRVYHWWLLFWPLEQLGDVCWLIGNRWHAVSVWTWRFTTPLMQRIDPVGVEFRIQQLYRLLDVIENDKKLEHPGDE